jgi:hypothetical protein
VEDWNGKSGTSNGWEEEAEDRNWVLNHVMAGRRWLSGDDAQYWVVLML